MSKKVGVIGLGSMGQGVARNLLKAGFTVYGFDVRQASVDALVGEGGIGCDSPASLGEACDVVITLVVNAAQTEAALLGENGAATTMRAGTTVIASSTVSPAFIGGLAERLTAKGIHLLDSPVTGGVVGAVNGTLTLLTSGPSEAYANTEGILEAISAKIYRFGTAHGLGSKIKVINQLLVGVQIAAAAEAVALGIREGVDPDALYDVITHSAGQSWAFTDRVPHILNGDYAPASAVDIFVKDLGLVLDTARESGFPVPLSSTAFQMFTTASAAGFGREDDAAVIKIFPGITLPPKIDR